MCGIAGIVERQRKVDPSILERMLKAQLHRGPDGGGLWQRAELAIGMRRLSIIDLEHGWQPFHGENGRCVLVANGEIYNHAALRDELIQRGHIFATKSDCEVILHLYEEYGDDCVSRLRGMFAFALWDEDKGRLFLARDRMGEKPLYLYESEGRLVFASELKALLASGLVPFSLSPEGVDDYFHYGFVPEPASIVAGVRKLPAASTLSLDLASWTFSQRRYWNMLDAPPLRGKPSQLIAEVFEELGPLVLQADVDVGVALSGGLDSSFIAALAARSGTRSLKAFGVGYKGRPGNDERAEAKALADHLGISFHDVELDVAELTDDFPELVRATDDPIADIAGYGYLALTRLARRHNVPVLLQGHGGDELFWGYSWVRQSVRETNVKDGQRSPLGAYAHALLPTPINRRGLRRWLRGYCGLKEAIALRDRLKCPPPERMIFFDLVPDYAYAERQLEFLYSPFLQSRLQNHDASAWFSTPLPRPGAELCATELISSIYLRENGIVQGDRLSMASSIEMRLPFVDHVLVDTVIGLRKTQPDSDLPPKAWLKETARRFLPDFVLQRPKRGFAPPTRQWQEALFERHRAAITKGRLMQAGVLSEAGLSALMSRLSEPDGRARGLVYKILVLETWCAFITDQPFQGLAR
jgi:asparagine synthase (glutamine-hydrolysing)